MERQMDEVLKNVKEVQTTSRFALKRLNQVLASTPGAHRQCESTDRLYESLTEIDDLSSRVCTLQEEDKQMDRLISSSVEEIKSLKIHLELLKKSVKTDPLSLKGSAISTGTDCDRSGHVKASMKEAFSVSTETNDGTLVCDKEGDTISDQNPDTHSEADSEDRTRDDVRTDTKQIESIHDDDNGEIGDSRELVGAILNQDLNSARGTDCTEISSTSDDDQVQSKKSVKFNEKVTQKLLRQPSVTDETDKLGGDGNKTDIKDSVETVGLNDTLLGAAGGKTESTFRKILRAKHRKSHKRLLKGLNSSITESPKHDAISTSSETPTVVTQTQVQCYDDLVEWEHLAAVELQGAWDSGLLQLGGVHTVLLLDISESMIPHWNQVKQFVNDYIYGIELYAAMMQMNQEHVAMVTFGHETKVQIRLTNNFDDLRKCFRGLKLGGPSPMYGGIQMAHVAVGAADCQIVKINEIPQPSRVVLLTDGYPTQPTMFAGPDESGSVETKPGQEKMIEVFEALHGEEYELYVVPVGNADMEFLNRIVSIHGGKMLDYKDGHQFSRKFYLMYNTVPMSLSLGFPMLSDGGSLSEADKKDLEDVKLKMKKRENDTYHEESNSKLPVVGSRVRRGTDWEYDDQDSGGPGTVVGHTKGVEGCFVNWDLNGIIEVYMYGGGGKYHVRLVDEPRYLPPGEVIAVGCIVKPGLNWKSSFEDISDENLRGIVLRLTLEEGDTPKALVRWQNGKRGVYTYMHDAVLDPEIAVCQETSQQSPPKQIRKTTRNKNKNIR